MRPGTSLAQANDCIATTGRSKPTPASGDRRAIIDAIAQGKTEAAVVAMIGTCTTSSPCSTSAPRLAKRKPGRDAGHGLNTGVRRRAPAWPVSCGAEGVKICQSAVRAAAR